MAGRIITLERLKKHMPKIHEWISGAGGEVLKPTNQWEILRFRANGITSIVYQDASGCITHTGESHPALDAFFTSKPWHGGPKKRRRKGPNDIDTIRARDGDLCFACAWPVLEADESVDHLVPIAHRGNNHIGNKVLMHKDCNTRCGHMSAPEKIKMHVESIIVQGKL